MMQLDRASQVEREKNEGGGDDDGGAGHHFHDQKWRHH